MPVKASVEVNNIQQFFYRCMQEMKKCVQSISGIRDHENYDAFFLCVMSHGAAGVVYGVDGVGVDIKTDIVEPFHQDRCRALCGKPKIFLFQACQGGS